MDRVRAWSVGASADPVLGRRATPLGKLTCALATVTPVAAVGTGAVVQLVQRTGEPQEPLSLAIALSALLIASLAWRQRFPLTTFAVIAAVALVQWIADLRLVADIALLVAVYSVAARHPLRTSLAAAFLVEFGAVLAVVRWNLPEARVESFILLTGPVLAALFAGIAVRTQRSALAAAIERGELAQRERDQAAAIEVARERARIAREMHDVVAHGLSIMVTLSDAAVAKSTADPTEAASAMRQVSATGREALGDMRRLLGVLRTDDHGPANRPQPGLVDLDTLVGQVRQTGVTVESTTHGHPRELGHGVQLTVYRIVQEALTNVMKHATQPALVEVAITYSHDAVEVRVDDDGNQQAPEPFSDPGFGIAGLSERVAAYGGRVDAGPRPDRGWRLVATIPFGEVGR